MASDWPSFAKQKIYLASSLLRLSNGQTDAPAREAVIQGAIALLGEARKSLLGLIADAYQVRKAQPQTLDELETLLENTCAELEELRQIAGDHASWWQHIEQLTALQQRPAKVQNKAIAQDNLIAVSAVTGPDRSLDALQASAQALKHYIDSVVERHAEW
ncbi:DUF6586 family protein [Marinobacter sp. 1Y8]